MIGQRLAPRLALGRCIGRRRALAARLLQLRQQAGFVLVQRLLEQRALLGAHRFGLGTEAPGLVACQLEGQLLYARLLELVVAGQTFDAFFALLDVLILLAQPREHLSHERGDDFGRQTLQVFGLEIVQRAHAAILPTHGRGVTRTCSVNDSAVSAAT